MFSLAWLTHLCSSVFSPANTLAFISFLLVYFLVKFYRRRRDLANIPPGPMPWPVVGNFGGFFIPSFIKRRFGQQSESTEDLKNTLGALAKLTNIYGNVYSLFVGSQLVVVLNGYEAVRDALSNHPEVFSDRPDIPAITILTKRKGKKLMQFDFRDVVKFLRWTLWHWLAICMCVWAWIKVTLV